MSVLVHLEGERKAQSVQIIQKLAIYCYDKNNRFNRDL